MFSWPVRVYWEDTDAGGIVFYANYLKFFERARTEWLRSMGIGQQELKASTGGMFVVVETSVRYLRPARLDDELMVTASLQQSGRASMTIEQQVLKKTPCCVRVASASAGSMQAACRPRGSRQPSSKAYESNHESRPVDC
jgi:tol-pal system-associated acyl-CoA thioesterase